MVNDNLAFLVFSHRCNTIKTHHLSIRIARIPFNLLTNGRYPVVDRCQTMSRLTTFRISSDQYFCENRKINSMRKIKRFDSNQLRNSIAIIGLLPTSRNGESHDSLNKHKRRISFLISYIHFTNGVNIKRNNLVIDDRCSTAFHDLLHSFHLLN